MAGAEGMYRRVVGLDSTVADGYYQLGVVLDDEGRYEEAVSSYRRVLALDPGRVEVHSNLGVTYYNMGRYRESLEEFEAYRPHVEDPEERESLDRFIGEIRRKEEEEGG